MARGTAESYFVHDDLSEQQTKDSCGPVGRHWVMEPPVPGRGVREQLVVVH